MEINEKYSSMLKDIKEENVTLDEIYLLSAEFEKYEIKDECVYGKGRVKLMKLENVFKKNNKVDLILDLLRIGNVIYNSKEIKKIYRESVKGERIENEKPYIDVDIRTLTDEIRDKIIMFFNKYGMIQSEKIELKIFLRRVIEFYCTVKLFEKIDEKDIAGIEDDMIFILYPQYRQKNKESIYRGIATNIQENGFLKGEQKSSVFDYFCYNPKIKSFQMFKMCNDYIILAYYQLANIILLKKNGAILPKCKICGDYINGERSSKEFCDSEECKKKRQRERKAKSREEIKKRKGGETK